MVENGGFSVDYVCRKTDVCRVADLKIKYGLKILYATYHTSPHVWPTRGTRVVDVPFLGVRISFFFGWSGSGSP